MRNLVLFFLRMTDGGMMVSIGDTTYTSFLKDEVSGYRVIINGKTCVFQKENDPTVLRYFEFDIFL